MKCKRLNSKKITAIMLVVLFSFVAIWEFTTVFVGISNYKQNSKMWDDSIGLIGDQHLNFIKNYKYGFGSVEKNGCGAVAAYNILYLENKKTPFPEIIKEFESGLYFFGLLGTKPTQIMSYLKKQGFDVQLHEDKSKFEELAKNSNYCIYVYAGFRGGHYQLLINQNNTSIMQTINPLGRITISEIMKKNQNNPINLLMTVN